MEYDRGMQGFEKVVDQRPNDPSAVNHLMSAVLMRALYRMGAMNTGEYANDSFVGEAHRAADPKVKERIKQLVERAETLEEQQLKTNPNNVDAVYARGVTRAQFSLYTALVERAWFSALRNAVGARHDHERVLELNPNYVDRREEGNLRGASGHAPEAAGGYGRVWQSGREGKYGNLHYETAAWGLGELLRSQKDYAGAASAYELVSQAPEADPETLQKANLAAGEMYDLMQKRDLAMKKYEIVLAQNGSTPPAEQARKHIREAYRA